MVIVSGRVRLELQRVRAGVGGGVDDGQRAVQRPLWLPDISATTNGRSPAPTACGPILIVAVIPTSAQVRPHRGAVVLSSSTRRADDLENEDTGSRPDARCAVRWGRSRQQTSGQRVTPLRGEPTVARRRGARPSARVVVDGGRTAVGCAAHRAGPAQPTSDPVGLAQRRVRQPVTPPDEAVLEPGRARGHAGSRRWAGSGGSARRPGGRSRAAGAGAAGRRCPPPPGSG